MNGEERERLLQQVYRYAWFLDEKQFDRWIELFAEGASYVVTTEENVRCGYAFAPIRESKETLRERLAEWQRLWWIDPAVTSRVIANPLVEAEGPIRARVRFYMMLYRTKDGHLTELVGCAKCSTLWEKEDDCWRLREFTAILDSGIIPGVLEIF
ncbi:hypothetical protein HRbin10_01944 [bacterium HR10]|nr:hypothetical protein HRbin10_01944 [bacterium HR10]